MKVSILFEECKEDVGYDGQVILTRDDIEDLTQLANFLSDAVRGAGFSYVNTVAFEKDDGDMVFGDF